MHQLAHAARVDALTGLFNRSYLDARLHQEIERAKRGSSTLTLLMLDVADVKVINDTYGHPTGDAVLRMVGDVLRSAVRVFDACARYGGDEFAILMPSSDRSSVAVFAERIRVRVSESCARRDGAARVSSVTVRIGVAVLESGDEPQDILRRVDRSLHRAKSAGKNRVLMNEWH